MNRQPTIIVIAGPTAVGKTAMAIRLAKHLGTSIISADSRQCYRELCIGVARPSTGELATVPHHFIASHSIHQQVDASVFERYALQTAATLFQQHPVVVLTGGTGMYIRAFLEGLDAIPETSTTVQAEVRSNYAANGLAWLQAAVRTEDPVYFSAGETANPQRLMRALEVKRSTGQSIRFYQNHEKAERPFRIIKTALQLLRPVLNERIALRVEQMMETGLLAEAASLLPYQQLQALQTVGYQELFDYFNGKQTLPQAVEQIKIHTRQYAKRQMTWFARDQDTRWLAPDDWSGLLRFVEPALGY